MGLLNRMDNIRYSGMNNSNMPQWYYAYMSNEEVDIVTTLFKRLVIRGSSLVEEDYNSDSKIWLCDDAKGLRFITVGRTVEQRTDKEYRGYTSFLFIANEVWKVKKSIAVGYDGNVEPLNLTFEFIPEKIGRESNNRDLAYRYALDAMKVVEMPINETNYINSLANVFDRNMVESMVSLGMSWYSYVLQDEGMKGFVKNTTVLLESKDNDFTELRIVESAKDNLDSKEMAELLENDGYILEQKLLFVNQNNGMLCFKIFKINEEPDVYKQQKEYYCVMVERGLSVASTINSSGKIIISKIKQYKEHGMKEELFLESLKLAIKTIEKTNYLNVEVIK